MMYRSLRVLFWNLEKKRKMLPTRAIETPVTRALSRAFQVKSHFREIMTRPSHHANDENGARLPSTIFNVIMRFNIMRIRCIYIYIYSMTDEKSIIRTPMISIVTYR